MDWRCHSYDRQGKFAGIASTALETTRVAGFLTLQTHGQGQAYLVSDTGKAIADPDARLVASFADLSATAPVAKALYSGDPDSSITYTGEAGEQLAGYAHVPGLNWIVVIEQPSSEALAGIRSARNVAFGVLLLSVLATAAAGWWVAARLVRPLAALGSAATALASGDSEAPLPHTRIIETDRLAHAFRQMRAALAARTGELQRSEANLRETADDLASANETLNQSRLQLQALTRRLMEVQESERQAMSRDLHDTAGQSMTALKLGLEMLLRETDASAAMHDQIAELRQTAVGVMEDLHRLAVNLRPSSLDRFGLEAALNQLVSAFCKQSDAEIGLMVDGMEGERLPGEVETALYRVIQELLTNIVRHAHASHVSVIVRREAGRVQVIVEDDGAGLDVEDAFRRGRLGLLGMRERAEMLGGGLVIESRPGAGTTVVVEIPLSAPPPAG